MFINILIDGQVEFFELNDLGTFESLYKDLEEKYGPGLLRNSATSYLEHDIVAESDLACGDELVYEYINDQNFHKLDYVIVLNWKGEECYVPNTFGVSLDSIRHSMLFANKKNLSNGTFKAIMYPIPEHFLPVVKDDSDLPPYRFIKKRKDANFDGIGTATILKDKFSFNFHDKEIEKSEKFYHNMIRRYELSLQNRVTDFISSKLKETKSVISGSFILYDLGLSSEFDDIDVFSESLDLLVDLINFGGILRPVRHCFKSSFLSYKLTFNVNDRNLVINFIHVNCDGVLTNDIENSSQERVLKFICQRFDISCCITAFDGENIHYHDSLYSKVFDVCGKTTDYHVANRILKYIYRGFEIGDIKHTDTCQRLYSDKPAKVSKTQSRESDTMLHVAKRGNSKLLKVIVKHVNVDLFSRKAIDRFVYNFCNKKVTYIISKTLGHRFYRNDWYHIVCGSLSSIKHMKKIFALMSDMAVKDVISKAINRRNCKFLLIVFKNTEIEIPRKKFVHEYCCRDFKCRIYEKIMANDGSVESSDCGFSRDFY